MIFSQENKCLKPIYGFSLVELVVTMILIGIVVAAVGPKFISLSTEAVDSQVKKTGAAFHNGIKLAHSVWIATGINGPVDDLHVYSNTADGTLDFNADGWPAQHYTGPAEANPTLSNIHDCISVWNAVLQASEATVAANNSADYIATYIATGKCKFERTENTAYIIEYDSNTGEVDTTIP